MKLDKTTVISNFVIIILYSSAFSQIIRGILNTISPSLKFLFVFFNQSLLYLVPITLFFLVMKKNKVIIYIGLLFGIYIIMIPFFQYHNLLQNIMGIKNYFIPLLYIPIIGYIYKNKTFRYKIERAMLFIFISYASVAIFEMLSVFYPTNLSIWYKSLANENMSDIVWRPLGLYLNIHTQGTVLALGSLYFLFKKEKLLFFLTFLGLIMSSVKTWIIAFIITYILYVLFNILNKRNIIISLLIIFTMSSVLLLPKDTPILGYYIENIVDGSSSHGTNRFKDKIFLLKTFINNALVPNGFISRSSSSSSILNTDVDKLPFYYIDNEIFLYDMFFQIGLFMTILWIYIIWNRLFGFKNGFIFKNQYKTLLFLALFSLPHTSSLNYIFIFIMIAYFSESSRLSKILINTRGFNVK